MVVIQMAKDFLPIRPYFQKAWVIKWIKQRSEMASGVEDRRSAICPSRVEEDLLRCAGQERGRYYLYSLPIEELCGQINAAMQAVMEKADTYGDLIRVFAVTASKDDLEKVVKLPPLLAIRDDMPSDERKKIEEYAQARNHVAHHIERAVDGLQITIGSRWKILLQGCSVALGILFAALGVGIEWMRGNCWAAVRDVLSVGLVAGYLAPVARDILVRIQQGGR
ncbi:MAG: hypothetical protein LAO09_02515 [Acidobacteriia bacterium]|nr:hypothetical protein [Terriglobia bacterium]